MSEYEMPATVKYLPDTPEYEAYVTKLREELGKWSRGESPYEYALEEAYIPLGRGKSSVTHMLGLDKEDMKAVMSHIKGGDKTGE